MKIALIAAVSILVSNAAAQTNLVRNSTFSDSLAGWVEPMFLGSARGSVTVEQGVCRIRVDATGETDWSVQLRQSGLRLDSGAVYRFSFDARASMPCVITSAVGRDGGDYAFYSGSDPAVRLATHWNRYESVFVMDSPTDTGARVQFNCGLAQATIEIDNVDIVRVTEPCLFLVSPAGGELIPGGTPYDIRWIGRGMVTITLHYSDDGGLIWIPIGDFPAAQGRCSWPVPGNFAPWVLLRIAVATGGLADTSGFFEISARANLIANGTFTEGMKPWNLAVYGGDATADTDSNRLAIRIIHGADLPWKIQLTCPRIELIQGVRYAFSFTAWADAPRPIEAGLSMDGGTYTSYVDSLTRRVSLSKIPTRYRTEFLMQMPSDSAARIEFNLAESDADVYISGVRLERVIGLNAMRTAISLRPPIEALYGRYLVTNGFRPTKRFYDCRGRRISVPSRVPGVIIRAVRSPKGIQ
jgi:hypothetical protein